MYDLNSTNHKRPLYGVFSLSSINTTITMNMEFALKELVLFIISIFNLCIGFFVLMKQPKRLVHQSFWITAVGISFWSLGLIMITETGNFFPYNDIIVLGFIVLLFGFIIFASVFPNRTHLPKKFWLVFLPLAFLAAATPFNLVIKGAIFYPDAPANPVNGPLFPVFAIVSVASILFGLILFFRTYKKAVGLAHLQMQYLLFGLAVFLSCAAVFDVLLPLAGIFSLNFIGPISSVALTGATAYAIIRHQLLDIRVVIQRSLIYTALFTLLVGIYIGLTEFLGYFLSRGTNLAVITGAGITMVFGVFFIQPLKNYFHKATDHIFFKGGYKYAESLYQLSHVLYTTIKQEDILADTRAILQNIFKTEEVTFVINPEAVLAITDKDQSSGFSTLAAPIMFEDKSVGVLYLGKKRSGDAYTEQDRQLISTFVFQIAIALGKAKLYAKVEEHNARLEQLVEERTREIKKMQEDQRQTMIDISHNLQTPIAIIRGELELLGDASGETEKMLVVEKSIDRVSAFIRKLLHLARLENSVYAVELSRIDLAKLLSAQIDYFEVMAEEKGVRISCAIKGPAFIKGDKQLLEELFANLVVNAITYRREDIASSIFISLAEVKDGYEVRIEDNGMGIAPDQLPELFTRFYPMSGASNIAHGTGLGLAIAKNIVEKHGGTISVESVLGNGTTFVVRLGK